MLAVFGQRWAWFHVRRYWFYMSLFSRVDDEGRCAWLWWVVARGVSLIESGLALVHTGRRCRALFLALETVKFEVETETKRV